MDPYQRPPDIIRTVYKKYQKMTLQHLNSDTDMLDLSNTYSPEADSKVRLVKEVDPNRLTASFREFAGGDVLGDFSLPERVAVYEHSDMPALQSLLLSRLLHRDLSHPTHLTNIHTHYTLNYPPPSSSFFSLSPSSPIPVAAPHDPTIHRPLSITPLLTKKLRWMTLGGQYNWTEKKYPETAPPEFPRDVGNLLESTFERTKAEAAIVNLYSPGDTLSVHRDVAEKSATGLISVSLGCDAVFVIGTEDENDGLEKSTAKVLTLRLRSGSAVYMTGSSRFAWHGVPQIVPGTCPESLASWPAGTEEGGPYEEWRGWMANKRVNLNVRQMWD